MTKNQAIKKEKLVAVAILILNFDNSTKFWGFISCFFLVTGYCNRACIYLIIEIHLEFWVYILIFQLSNILLIWKFTLTTGLGKYSTKCNTCSTAKCIIISTNIGKTICVGTLWLVQPFQAKWKLHVVMKCYVDAQFWSTW